jgi:hypothetical protein
MRLFTTTLCAVIAAGLLAGCSGSSLSTPSSSAPVKTQANHLVSGRFIPGWSKFASLIPVELQPTPQRVLDRIVPARHKKKGLAGVYGSEYLGNIINDYKGTDPKNGPPVCTLKANYPNDIAVDGKGNLIDPDTGTRTVIVYKPSCGRELGVLGGSYYLAEPSDAASFNAATGTIIVGNIFSTSGEGTIAICTLSGGCTTQRTNYANIYELAGVALAKNGDCWGSASDSAGTATMTYFKHCSGPGQAATGWKNTYYGGLDIDTHGNIVAVDAFVPQLWIYRGCNPACHVVGGPFPLHGDTVFGHLNRTATQWVGGDYQNGMLDVYQYSTRALTYEYSISNGLNVSDEVEGAAFSPSSQQ